jgi:septum formation protein
MTRIVLASGSAARLDLLRRAGLEVEPRPVRVDEEAIRAAMAAEGADPREVADGLAEQKARRASARDPEALVLGCDQILEVDGQILAKPVDATDLRRQIETLAGATHRLLSACVAYRQSAPLWRHVGIARLHMREPSAHYLEGYIQRNWNDVRHCVGGYMIEGEGVRLFDRIEGDLFTIMGLPLVELLNWLTMSGEIEG